MHLVEPAYPDRTETLKDAGRRAFEIASQGTGLSVALRPIGLDAGWPIEIAMAETKAAAETYADEAPGRRVVIVEPADAKS